MRAALSALHYSGVDELMAPFTGGAGVIFTLHHVRPDESDAFDPNGILRVTPEFLDLVVRLVRERGFDVVHYRLSEGDLDRPFACFTFDDGYRDNHEYAYPIFRDHGLPFAVYVTTDFADGRGDLWWLSLEKVIRETGTIELKMDGAWRRYACATPAEKAETFRSIYWWLRRAPESEARHTVAELCRAYGVDVSRLCSDLAMTWGEIRDLARDPLVTIGAHTRRHYAIAPLSLAEARLEIAESTRHFSFPYGDEQSAGTRDFELVRELGFKTAVTTRKQLIHARHSGEMTGSSARFAER